VLRFSDGDTQALLDHDAVPYIDTRGFDGQIEIDASGNRTLDGDRQDYGVQLGATQILSRNALVESSVAYGRNRGYLENPYKVVEVGSTLMVAAFTLSTIVAMIALQWTPYRVSSAQLIDMV
jgi:hypothetical protein